MKRFSIGYRTLKTAVGVALAVALGYYFELDFYGSAAILTILCIQTTKKKSLHAVYTRVVASLIVMILAYILFEWISYNPAVLGVLIILLVPILVALKVAAGFVSSAVILMHIYAVQHFTLELFWNELAVMAIGYGVALAVNMNMPDNTKKMDAYRQEIEEDYRVIFSEIVKYLRNGDASWDGVELIHAADTLNKAKALAYLEVENHLTRKENLYYTYFDMREKQLEIIERVLPKVTTLPVIVQQSDLVADFIQDLGEHVHSGNTASSYRQKLDVVREEFANMPLPQDHETFQAMAGLYAFIEEMDEYLAIKQNFKGISIKK